jgi:uncharacterized protein (TIGR02598 family)
MKTLPVRLVLPRAGDRSAAGFTLVELVLAVAIVATAMVVLLGLFPAGLDTSRKAIDSTVVTQILGNLRERLQGQPLRSGALPFSPAFFDEHGAFLAEGQVAAERSRRRYRAELKIVDPAQPPAGTSSLRPLIISIYWPIDPATGEPLGKSGPRLVTTTAVSAATGPAWQAIDATYVPKIEL